MDCIAYVCGVMMNLCRDSPCAGILWSEGCMAKLIELLRIFGGNSDCKSVQVLSKTIYCLITTLDFGERSKVAEELFGIVEGFDMDICELVNMVLMSKL